MPSFDPLSDRIADRRDAELEHLRGECNRLASERDLLVKERDEAQADVQRLIQSASNLLAANRDLSDQLKRALSPERSAA